VKVKKIDWYGFNHKKVYEKFEGDLTFINEFSVRNWDRPVAVYHNANPNREKNHKDYMLLFMEYPYTFIGLDEDAPGHLVVGGMDKDEMEKYRYQNAIHCLECDVVLYSVCRHHYHTCGCPNEAMIDGGRDYTRYGAKDMNKIRIVKLDLLTDTVIEEEKNEGAKSDDLSAE